MQAAETGQRAANSAVARIVGGAAARGTRHAARGTRHAARGTQVKPAVPTAHQLRVNGCSFAPHFLHQTWRDYLYSAVELDA